MEIKETSANALEQKAVNTEVEEATVVNPVAEETASTECPAQSTVSGTGTKSEEQTAVEVHPFGNPNLKNWDGKPLVPEKFYHLNDMIGFTHVEIKENRDAIKRYSHWEKEFSDNIAMASPAIYVKARIVKEAGLTPVMEDPATHEMVEVPEDKLDSLYCIADGHGRHYYYQQDLKKAMVMDSTYSPLDFIFFVREYSDPEIFRKELVSINNAQQKTTNVQLASMMQGSVKDKNFKGFLADIQKKYVAKAAAIKNYGQELSNEDFKDLYAGKSIGCVTGLVKYMAKCYKCYEEIFTKDNELKILHGTPLAKFTKRQLLNEDSIDIEKKCTQIIGSFKRMQKSVADQIVSAKKTGNRSKETVLMDLFESILTQDQNNGKSI